MKIKMTCPLGSECETIKEGYIERCVWYSKLVGKDPQTEKEMDSWGCAISWIPIMLTEVAQTNRSQTAAINIQTTEQSNGMNIIYNLAKQAQKIKKIG